MNAAPPVPENEMERLLELSEFDLDYDGLQGHFKDLTRLAASVAGTEISLVNLIDRFTQWSVSSHGLDVRQTPREESACQYTIMGECAYEIPDLSNDERFSSKPYVTDAPRLRYYLGVPLVSRDGLNLGALCVLDTSSRHVTAEKVELLKIIADEIVNRLMAIRHIRQLQGRLGEMDRTQRKVAHDIRGPIGGIVGLAEVICEQGDANKLEEVLQFLEMIHKSGKSVLELAEEILSAPAGEGAAGKAAPAADGGGHRFTLSLLADKLRDMFTPQALGKKVLLKVEASAANRSATFSRAKLLQIAGNLISNAIKFSPEGGEVAVSLELVTGASVSRLLIRVADQGVGMPAAKLEEIIRGEASSTRGTGGESGYGFGLALVRHLVDSMEGSIDLRSTEGEGTTVEVKLPV